MEEIYKTLTEPNRTRIPTTNQEPNPIQPNK